MGASLSRNDSAAPAQTDRLVLHASVTSALAGPAARFPATFRWCVRLEAPHRLNPHRRWPEQVRITLVDGVVFERVAQHIRLVPADYDGIREYLRSARANEAANQSSPDDCGAAEGGGHGLRDGPADGGSDNPQLRHELLELLGGSDCAPSLSARSGSGCTSISSPSAPAATAARAMGATFRAGRCRARDRRRSADARASSPRGSRRCPWCCACGLERADAALAQDDVVVAAGHDVFGARAAALQWSPRCRASAARAFAACASSRSRLKFCMLRAPTCRMST